MNHYVRKLEAIKDQRYHELKEVGDQWRTGDALFHGIELLLPEEKSHKPTFVLDLFTDGQNSKCPDYFTAEDNALHQPWQETLYFLADGKPDYAFANPPYSVIQSENGDVITGMAPIMEKALEERENGGRFAFLIKAATSETWWPDTIPDRTIFIKGRVAFERPVWFTADPATKIPKQSAFFGCAVLLFNKHLPRNKEPLYIHRKELLAMGKKRAEELSAARLKHIKAFSL